jgi:hypothetical protein
VIFRVSNKDKPRKRPRRPHPIPVPVVSQETREGLYAEARRHPVFEGMEPEHIREYINERLGIFLSKQPWWYGHTGGHGGADTRGRAAARQYEVRREKERMAVHVPAKTIRQDVCESQPGAQIRGRDACPRRKKKSQSTSIDIAEVEQIEIVEAEQIETVVEPQLVAA